MSADDRLAITIKHSDGTQSRWGPDEPSGHDVPNDLQFSTSIPGGFKDCSMSLARDMSIYPDESLFDPILVYGAGGDPIWEGRMAAFPRGDYKVTPSAIGMVAHLRDDPSAREIYVDRDLTRWTGQSLNRQQRIVATGSTPVNGSVAPDPITGKPVIALTLSNDWGAVFPVVEMWYDAGAGKAIRYLFIAATNLSIGAPWAAFGSLMSDDSQLSYEDTPNMCVAGTWSGGKVATVNTRRFAMVQSYYAAAGGAPGMSYTSYFSPVIYCSQLSGQLLSDGSSGFFASDIVKDIVGRWAPMLKFTSPGSIEPTTFVIPQFAQYTATTADLMIAAANVFDLKDWGVYSGGEDGYPSNTFFYREPNPARLTWHARRSDGAVLTSEGVQAEQMVNGVIVNYSAPDGSNKVVGPPGSGVGYEDASLADTDPTNPVNAAGIPRKYGILNYSGVLAFPTDAVKIGSAWLSRRLGIARKGTLACTGWVKHPSGAMMPVAKMRAGDYVVVDDDRRKTGPRKIINTSYTHVNRTITCDLDFDAFRIDALMAQMGVELVGVN